MYGVFLPSLSKTKRSSERDMFSKRTLDHFLKLSARLSIGILHAAHGCIFWAYHGVGTAAVVGKRGKQGLCCTACRRESW